MGQAWLDGVISAVAQHGTGVWFQRHASEWLPAEWKAVDSQPEQTGVDIEGRECVLDSQGRWWAKGTDTLDVWFDSGSSWASTWSGEAGKLRTDI